MMKKACVAAAAIAVLASALTAVAADQPAQPAVEMEKCFGIAKAGQKGDGNENGAVFVNVAKGECVQKGGSLKAAVEAHKGEVKAEVKAEPKQ